MKAILFKNFSQNYHDAFINIGISTTFIECLQFIFINISLLEEKLNDSKYNGLILTSPRAIEAVSKCMREDSFWIDRRVYTVGECSGAQIKQLLNLTASGIESGNADNLAEIIIKENSRGAKYLFPCGNLKTETLITKLEKHGIIVDAVTVYETQENVELKNALKLSIEEDSQLALIFFSPSGVQFVVDQLRTLCVNIESFKFFAIGNSTSKKLEEMGLRVDGVATKPTAESLAEVVRSYFKTKNEL